MADAHEGDHAARSGGAPAAGTPHTQRRTKSALIAGLALAMVATALAVGVAIHEASQTSMGDVSVVPAITPVASLSTVPAGTWKRFGLFIGRPAGTPRISLADAEYRVLGKPDENDPHIIEAGLVQFHASLEPRGAGRLAWVFSLQPGLRDAFTTADRRDEGQLLVTVIDARTGRLLTSFSH